MIAYVKYNVPMIVEVEFNGDDNMVHRVIVDVDRAAQKRTDDFVVDERGEVVESGLNISIADVAQKNRGNWRPEFGNLDLVDDS